MQSAKCRVQSVECKKCGVWSGKFKSKVPCKEESVECRVWGHYVRVVKCGVCSVKCGVCSVKCGA